MIGRAGLAAGVLILGGCPAAEVPSLRDVSPASGPRGAHVEARGEGLCGRFLGDGQACLSTLAGRVYVGLDPLVAAPIVRWDDAAITFEVPSTAALGASDVVVVVDGRSSDAIAFTVTP